MREQPKQYVKQKSRRNKPPALLYFLISWYAVSINLVISDRIAVLAALVAGIALYRVDAAILDLLNDTHMVG